MSKDDALETIDEVWGQIGGLQSILEMMGAHFDSNNSAGTGDMLVFLSGAVDGLDKKLGAALDVLDDGSRV